MATEAKRYRVRVESFVVVEAANVSQAKARAELKVRQAVRISYSNQPDQWGDGWELFGFNAKKAERVPDDE